LDSIYASSENRVPIMYFYTSREDILHICLYTGVLRVDLIQQNALIRRASPNINVHSCNTEINLKNVVA